MHPLTIFHFRILSPQDFAFRGSLINTLKGQKFVVAFYGNVDGGEVISRIFGYGSELNKWRDAAILIGYVIFYHTLHFVVLWLVNRSYGRSQTDGFVADAVFDDVEPADTPDDQKEEWQLEFDQPARQRSSSGTASIISKDSLESFV